MADSRNRLSTVCGDDPSRISGCAAAGDALTNACRERTTPEPWTGWRPARALERARQRRAEAATRARDADGSRTGRSDPCRHGRRRVHETAPKSFVVASKARGGKLRSCDLTQIRTRHAARIWGPARGLMHHTTPRAVAPDVSTARCACASLARHGSWRGNGQLVQHARELVCPALIDLPGHVGSHPYSCRRVRAWPCSGSQPKSDNPSSSLTRTPRSVGTGCA